MAYGRRIRWVENAGRVTWTGPHPDRLWTLAVVVQHDRCQAYAVYDGFVTRSLRQLSFR